MILHPGCTHEALRLQRAERLAREADLLGHARTEITNEACSCSSIPLLHSIRTILQGSVKDDRTYLAVRSISSKVYPSKLLQSATCSFILRDMKHPLVARWIAISLSMLTLYDSLLN